MVEFDLCGFYQVIECDAYEERRSVCDVERKWLCKRTNLRIEHVVSISLDTRQDEADS